LAQGFVCARAAPPCGGASMMRQWWLLCLGQVILSLGYPIPPGYAIAARFDSTKPTQKTTHSLAHVGARQDPVVVENNAADQQEEETADQQMAEDNTGDQQVDDETADQQDVEDDGADSETENSEVGPEETTVLVNNGTETETDVPVETAAASNTSNVNATVVQQIKFKRHAFSGNPYEGVLAVPYEDAVVPAYEPRLNVSRIASIACLQAMIRDATFVCSDDDLTAPASGSQSTTTDTDSSSTAEGLATAGAGAFQKALRKSMQAAAASLADVNAALASGESVTAATEQLTGAETNLQTAFGAIGADTDTQAAASELEAQVASLESAVADSPDADGAVAAASAVAASPWRMFSNVAEANAADLIPASLVKAGHVRKRVRVAPAAAVPPAPVVSPADEPAAAVSNAIATLHTASHNGRWAGEIHHHKHRASENLRGSH